MPKDKFKSGSHYSHTQLPPEVTPQKKFKGFVITVSFANKLARNKQLIQHCQPVADKPFIRVVAEFVFGSDVVISPDNEIQDNSAIEALQELKNIPKKPEPDTISISPERWECMKANGVEQFL